MITDLTAALTRLYDSSKTDGPEAVELMAEIRATGFDLASYSRIVARGGWESLPVRVQGRLLREQPELAQELRREHHRRSTIH